MLPRDVSERHKQGFSVPIGKWLMNDLRPITEDMLQNPKSHYSEIILFDIEKKFVDSYYSSQFDYSRHIWLLNNLELWLIEFNSSPKTLILMTNVI